MTSSIQKNKSLQSSKEWNHKNAGINTTGISAVCIAGICKTSMNPAISAFKEFF